jgi:hypothetical protein
VTLGFPVELGLHTVHNARSPRKQCSLGAFNSSHQFTIGFSHERVKLGKIPSRINIRFNATRSCREYFSNGETWTI